MNPNKNIKISIVVPVFNERHRIEEALRSIESVDSPYIKEVIIVDDGSIDGTKEILKKYADKYKVISLEKNMGKGAAVRRGFKESTGDIVLVQDADLEYNPNEYGPAIDLIISDRADVVYGSRFVTAFPRRILYFSHYMANKMVTLLSNMFTGLNLSDMETGFKIFNRKAILEILPCLKSNRFGFEPEITAQVAKHDLRIYEVGISYRGRTYKEGKKLNWKDGVAAIWHIVRFNVLTRK